jgi:hypothetical protein
MIMISTHESVEGACDYLQKHGYYCFSIHWKDFKRLKKWRAETLLGVWREKYFYWKTYGR